MKGWEPRPVVGPSGAICQPGQASVKKRSLSREDAVMTTKVTRPRLASLETLCKRTGRHQATQDRTRHHEARSRVGLGSTREHHMTQDDTTVPELQNRCAGESWQAGSIPVRLRYEIRGLTSIDASGRPQIDLEEEDYPGSERPVPTPVFAGTSPSLHSLTRPPNWTSLPGADRRAGQVLMSGRGATVVGGSRTPTGGPRGGRAARGS